MQSNGCIHIYPVKLKQWSVMKKYLNFCLWPRESRRAHPQDLFFFILINSLPSCLKYCKFFYILFADDLQLFIQCSANLISSAVTHMTEEANNVSRWASEHSLQLNPGKTKSIIFGSVPNLLFLANQQLPSIAVDNHPLQYVCQIKNLGIIMTKDLTWNAHICSVSSKVHNALFKLRQRAWLLLFY